MKIVICIKSVPGLSEMNINPNTNTFIREGMELVINPADFYAIEEALKLKKQFGGSITAISMGPSQCIRSLREALSFGIDDAILLSSAKFAGADTLATAYTLSIAIKKLAGADIILLGKSTSDGNTGQVGPQLAEFLNITHITNVCKIRWISKTGEIIFEKATEDGVLVLKSCLPILFTVNHAVNKRIFPTLKGMIEAKKKVIPIWGANSGMFDINRTGISGSPTKVERIFKMSHMERKGRLFDGPLEESVGKLLSELRKKYVENKNN